MTVLEKLHDFFEAVEEASIPGRVNAVITIMNLDAEIAQLKARCFSLEQERTLDAIYGQCHLDEDNNYIHSLEEENEELRKTVQVLREALGKQVLNRIYLAIEDDLLWADEFLSLSSEERKTLRGSQQIIEALLASQLPSAVATLWETCPEERI